MSKKKPFMFPSDSESVRNRNTRKAPEPDTQKRYEELLACYLTDNFSNECYRQIDNIIKNAVSHIPELKTYPIKEVLINVSRKLLMNQLQFLFLGCLLDELKWQYTDSTIKNYANTLRPLSKNEPHENIDYKCMELYLLLSAYSVKVYLNEDIKLFEVEMNELLPKFQQIFHTWGSKFAMTALSTNPKKLNRKYIETSIKKSDASHEDFNKKVNELVETNPTGDVKEEVIIVKRQAEFVDQNEDILPPPPGLIYGMSGGSYVRNQSIPYDMFHPWHVRGDSFIEFPLIKQPSDNFGGILGINKLQNSDSDRQPR